MILQTDFARQAYNALGQRVRKTANGSSTDFIYSPQGQLLTEGTGVQYIHFDGQVVGYIKNNQLHYVHNDHLGRPEVVTKFILETTMPRHLQSDPIGLIAFLCI